MLLKKYPELLTFCIQFVFKNSSSPSTSWLRLSIGDCCSFIRSLDEPDGLF